MFDIYIRRASDDNEALRFITELLQKGALAQLSLFLAQKNRNLPITAEVGLT